MRLTQLRQADLNLLVVFAVFAEERNVSRAADRLFLSQPAVSRALQRLQDMLHDDLFVRTASGYELTLQGERVRQELERTLPRLDRLLSQSSFDPSVEQASFRIATTDSAASVFAPLICRNVLPSAEHVAFDFVQWHKGLFDDLAHGSVDLVLSASVVDAPPPLQSERIYDEELVCVVDAKSPLKRQVNIRQYMKAKHVIVSIQSGSQVAPDKHLAAQGYKRMVALQVPFHETAIRCVAGTRFIATIPRRFVEEMVQSPAIKILKAPTEVGGFRYVMVWHPRVNSDAAHTWLRATMRKVGSSVSGLHLI